MKLTKEVARYIEELKAGRIDWSHMEKCHERFKELVPELDRYRVWSATLKDGLLTDTYKEATLRMLKENHCSSVKQIIRKTVACMIAHANLIRDGKI